jgi:hypothetical protein
MHPARWRATLSLVLLTTLTACSDKATAPKPEQIAGTWTATRAEYVSKTTSSRVDLVAAGGSVTLLLETAGSYTYVEIAHGVAPDTTVGRWKATGDVMEFTPEGSPFSVMFDLGYSGNALNLTGGDVLHDFGSGGEESDLNLAFSR